MALGVEFPPLPTSLVQKLMRRDRSERPVTPPRRPQTAKAQELVRSRSRSRSSQRVVAQSDSFQRRWPSLERPPVAASSGSAVEREAPPAVIGTSLSRDVPEGYGCWDWEDDAHRHLEMQMAEDFSMPWNTRGPPSPMNDGPLLWKHMPFNSEKNCWGYWHRSQLPKEYTFRDWWSEEALELEAKFAREYSIPWQFRGPPTGPPPNEPRKMWRGRAWRPGSQKWMCRGGTHLAEHDAKFRKSKKK